MNFSSDFLRNPSSVSFHPPRLVKDENVYLNLLNSERRSRFLRNNNSNKKLKINEQNRFFTRLLHSNNELNPSLLNTRSLNKEFLHIFHLLTSSFIDFLGLTETWHEDATSPSLLSASSLSYSLIELARSPTKPFSSSHSSHGGIALFYESTFSAFLTFFSFWEILIFFIIIN